ncbi:ATP-binding protein [Paraburkholderia bryophila]|jgi:predicted ATPase/DNA-binding winged helix-turn-helix (wHTH) protein|uniref:Putative ATPase n=1 Tax=Paraburkholderia bryophila TaxID=420952 RepID=A0A329BV57_9BURK|nr:winged helix-turn-helix domain-containing protein [Paraburkholderia bryophila]RAS26446.1 putative ATPase [Paraburkholderia bryophila]
MISPYSIAFGPFTLHFPQRALTKNGEPVRLGSRALDILVVLVESAGTLMPTRDLCARVWADNVVDEGALRVHLSALRKALGDGVDGIRYIVNETGRGYRFAVPVSKSSAGPLAAPAPGGARTLPVKLARVIGRDEVIAGLTDQLPKRRLLTITGPGGMGKTTVALAIAHRFAEQTGTRALFVNFAPVSDASNAASTVASAVGVAVSTGDPVPDLIRTLADAPVLLVLDNCEHLIDAVAELAEQLLQAAPGVHLLVTSREPLRSEGESVHRLAALPSPDSGTALSTNQASEYPAIALFVDRANAANDTFALTEANATAVGDICRRLDGIPLAIEFAAARVGLMDVHAIAARLDDRFALLTQGRRTALPRQQTLRATLDWSYELLQPQEQQVLRRLSVMRASFDMSEAAAVARCEALDELAVFDATTGLIAKSLISCDVGDSPLPYRLLDTTRHYAHLRLVEAGETDAVRRRHAQHCCQVFADPAAAWEGKAPREWLAIHSRRIDDIRAAFEWASREGGERHIAITLVIVTAPLWFHLSLPHEFLGLAEHAIAAVEGSDLAGTPEHVELLAAYGHALWHTRGPTPAMAQAFEHAYEAACRLADLGMEMRTLWGIWAQRILAGSYAESLPLAEHFSRLAAGTGDLSAVQTADHMKALSHHFLGDQREARSLIEDVIARDEDPIRANHANHAQVDGRIASMSLLMRILWLQGDRDRALALARECAALALEVDHDLSICYGLSIGSIPVAIWANDLAMARELTGRLRERTRQRGLSYWDKWAESFAALANARPVAPHGATLMQLEVFASAGSPSCVNALIAAGRLDQPSWCRDLLAERHDASNAAAATPREFS